MQIKLTEAIRHRSAEYQAGDVLDLPDGEAHALIAAGHARIKPAAASTHSTPTPPQTTTKGK